MDESFHIKKDSFLFSISVLIPDPTYFKELNCKSPFNGTLFYKCRVTTDSDDLENHFKLLFSSEPISTQEFSIIIRKGSLISSKERTISYLINEIQCYQKINEQNDIFVPLGFLITDNEYEIFFQTKQEQITSIIQNFSNITLEQRFIIINQLASILLNAHQNRIIGFYLSPFNIFYDKYSKRISIFGYFGNEDTLDLNYDVNWSCLLAPELISGDNYPSIYTDIFQISALIGIVLDHEMEKWRNGQFDHSFADVEQPLYEGLQKAISKNPTERGNLKDMLLMIRNCCQTYIGDSSMQTLKLIKNNLHGLHLDELKGMDMVIFLGNTQVGKSSTINALRGCKFINQKGRIKQTNNIENEAKMGDKSGISCTSLPTVYIDHNNNIAYLDTRGFNDVRDQESPFEIASSFLIEIAIRTAKNIRLVVLEKFSKLKAGLAEFNQIGQAVQKIIKDQKSYVNFFFLFNRYTISSMEEAEEFFTLSEVDKTKKIFEEIIENVNNMLEADFDRSKYKYLTLLYTNISLFHFGYIDICNLDSINRVLLSVKSDALNVNRNDLKFTGFNEERLKFNDIFIPRLTVISYLIKSLLKLPDEASMDQLTSSLKDQITVYKQHIEKIQTLNEDEIHEALDPLKQMYEQSSKEEMTNLVNSLNDAKKELNDAMAALEKFMSEKEIVFYDNWECKGTDYTHKSKYKGKVPWIKEKVIFSNPDFTKIKRKKAKPYETHYMIEFENISPPLRESEIINDISIGIEGGFEIAKGIITGGLCTAMVAGVVGVFLIGAAPFSITGALLSSSVVIAKGALYAGGASLVAGPVLGTTIGVINDMNIPRGKIAGEVILFALKKDMPSRQIELIDFNGRIDNIKTRIVQINNDIIALDKMNADEILLQIKDKKEKAELSLLKIAELKNAIKSIYDFFVSNADDISVYVEISERLSDSSTNSNQNLFNCISQSGNILLNWIKNGQKDFPTFHWEENGFNNQISENIEYINQMKKDLEAQERFGIYDLNPFKQ